MTNTQIDGVRIWTTVDQPGMFADYLNVNNAIYPANELQKNVTIDEHGKQVIEFKDKEGKVILKKVQLLDGAYDNGSTGKDHTGWLCTYYVYDRFSQLRGVIQPKAVEAMHNANNWSLDVTSLEELTFRYEYDTRGRMTMKKVPGAGAVYMVYDVRDRLVLTQDANMRTSNQWLATLYDGLNRPVLTGMITYGATLATFQTEVTQQTAASGSTVSPDLIFSFLHPEFTRQVIVSPWIRDLKVERTLQRRSCLGVEAE